MQKVKSRKFTCFTIDLHIQEKELFKKNHVSILAPCKFVAAKSIIYLVPDPI